MIRTAVLCSSGQTGYCWTHRFAQRMQGNDHPGHVGSLIEIGRLEQVRPLQAVFHAGLQELVDVLHHGEVPLLRADLLHRPWLKRVN